MASPYSPSLELGHLSAPHHTRVQLEALFYDSCAQDLSKNISPMDRYVILCPDRHPRFSSNDINAISLWFWGRCLAKNDEALRAHPWVVLDYERPIYIGCASVNCLGKRLGDPFFAQDAVCINCQEPAVSNT